MHVGNTENHIRKTKFLQEKEVEATKQKEEKREKPKPEEQEKVNTDGYKKNQMSADRESGKVDRKK
jgi:hypothetical protein